MNERVKLLENEIGKTNFLAYSFFESKYDKFVSNFIFHHITDNEQLYIVIGVIVGFLILTITIAIIYLTKQK